MSLISSNKIARFKYWMFITYICENKMFKELLTEPKEHNPTYFIYLVHSFLSWKDYGISNEEMKEKVSKLRNPNQFYRANIILKIL